MSINLLLRNRLPPGDVLMLTAAVRDLHRAHPGIYRTVIDTACPALWENNPLVAAPPPGWVADRVIDCEYPLIHDANYRPYHFIHGFLQDLERKLEVSIPVGPFRGDIYLSEEEMRRPSVTEAEGTERYWVIAAGGKYDFTAKWWDPDSWQAVVDHFRGRIRFVHVGAAGDFHPPLDGVLDLVGKTGLRELIRIIHHADGVVCPVTFAMHLAAAVPTRGAQVLRPCVVVAGGREPAHWEQYPGHQFLHTVGALDCCATGGCWKARCQPLGDGDPCDADLCTRPVSVRDGIQVGKCMTLIPPSRVIDAISLYYLGGALKTSTIVHPSSTHSAPAAPFGSTLNRPAPPPAPPQNHPQPPAAPAPAPSPAPSAPRSPRTQNSPRPPLAVTIGVGSFSEIAHLAAREMHLRTGLATVVLDVRAFADSGLPDPTWLKFRLFDFVDADDILYFDADTVCLEPWDPTQHPAPLFGSDAIGCVRERMIPLILAESADWSVPPAEHFNTGLLVINRRHHAQWLRRAEELAVRAAHPTLLRDQLPLNAARCELGIPLRLLDRRYNWVGFGAGSLSHDFPVVLAHRLAPARQDLNVAYFKGEYHLAQPRYVPDDRSAAELHGRIFAFHDGAGRRRVVRFREDGTLMPPGDCDAEGYWFVHTQNGRPTLALASDTAVLHHFIRVLNGTWVSLASHGADPSHDGPRLIEQCEGPGPMLNEESARTTADAFIRSIPPYPGSACATDSDSATDGAPMNTDQKAKNGAAPIGEGATDGASTDQSNATRTATHLTSSPSVSIGAPSVANSSPAPPSVANPRFQGRGIVVCGGGVKYFPCAYVCIRMLRQVGCTLPIELWHLNAAELPDPWRNAVAPYNVRCVNAEHVRQRHPVRNLTGWPLKPYALLHSAFEEVMGIDADNVVVRDPAYLFDSAEFKETGAVFWPDFDRLAPDRAIWRICGVGYRDEPEIESGQLLIDKRRCWRPLNLTLHLNEHADFYYEYVHGDKETFHMAWRMLNQDYALIPHPIRTLQCTMCQHDFEGRRLFQHRNLGKWKLDGENFRVEGFEFEEQCLAFLGELDEHTRPAARPQRTPGFSLTT